MASVQIGGSSLGNQLQEILVAEDIQPGDEPSYQLCKTLYLYHPLGSKMAESPVKMAQSQKRLISVPAGPEEKVKAAFEAEWKNLGATRIIRNLAVQSRVYGIASLAVKDGGDPSKPLDFAKLATTKIAFSVFDPLNTAGSLVLNQDTDAFDFQKVQDIRVNGQLYHRSRTCVLMNEDPIYIAYTTSAFGYVGRSVYQRALFPLKSFLQTMLTDDLVTIKAGVLVAKIKQAGSIIDNMMQKLFGIKRSLLKQAATGQVLSIGPDDDIESLNFQNLDKPYELVRGNILKNIATASDMPAFFLENETLTAGFGEGAEDAKNIDEYIKTIREWLDGPYDFMTQIVQYRAWGEDFYKTIQADFPEYRNVSYTDAFYRWKNSFAAQWPNLLEEPDSEKSKAEKVRLEAIVQMLEALIGQLDPENKAILVEWAQDNFNELKMIFPAPLQLDIDALANYEPPVPEAPAEDDDAKADSDDVLSDLREVRDSMLRVSAQRALQEPPRQIDAPPISINLGRDKQVRTVRMERQGDGSVIAVLGDSDGDTRRIRLAKNADGSIVGRTIGPDGQIVFSTSKQEEFA